jgi:predicted enzyme related to lactoylglutathione lyase
MARLNYLELPVAHTIRSSAFYSAAFGMAFTTFAPTYAATMTGDTDLGFQADPAEKTAGPLSVIQVDDLGVAEAAVRAAGGDICVAPFAFPGGRRFHFRDPDGHELAVAQYD